MKPETKKRLRKRGWKVGDAKQFLGLSKSEQKEVNRRIKEKT